MLAGRVLFIYKVNKERLKIIFRSKFKPAYIMSQNET